MKIFSTLIFCFLTLVSQSQILQYNGDGFILVKDSVKKERLNAEVYTAFLGEHFVHPTFAEFQNDKNVGKFYKPKLFLGEHMILRNNEQKWGALSANLDKYFEFIYNYQPYIINDTLSAIPAIVDGGYQDYYGYHIVLENGEVWTDIRSIVDEHKGYFLIKYSDYYSIYDPAFNTVVPGAYLCTSWDDKNFGFNELGNIALKNTNDKCGMVNYKGEEILPFEYEFISDPFEEANLIKKDGLWGAVDPSGKIVIPISYEVLEYDFKGYDTSFVKKKGEWMMVNKALEPINDLRFTAIYPDDRYHPIKIVNTSNGKQGMYDFSKSTYLISAEFDTIYQDKEQIIAINEKTINYYNANAELIKQIDPSQIQLLDDAGQQMRDYLSDKGDLIIHLDKGKKGISSSQGEVLIPAIYDTIIQDYKKFFVMKDGKCGWINIEGKILVPCEYDIACNENYISAYDCGSSCMLMQKGNEAFLFNENGELIEKRTFSTFGGPCDAFK